MLITPAEFSNGFGETVSVLSHRGNWSELMDGVGQALSLPPLLPDSTSCELVVHSLGPMPETKREFLPHTLATLVYRDGKMLRDAPPEFATSETGGANRTPLKILAHINDLLDWAWSMACGERKWNESAPQSWSAECDRFSAAAKKFDDFLASDTPLSCKEEQLFQGPVADAIAHGGQLAMLRRLAGAPIPGENYFKADIAAGRVGPDQTAPKFTF